MNRVLTVLCVLLASAAVLAAIAKPAGAASTSHLDFYSQGATTIRNYDFNNQVVTATGVDWAVDLLFIQNATINKVKAGFPSYDQGGTCASAQYGRMNDNGAGYVWDSDQGKKTTCCPITGSDYHFRVYADSDDRLGYSAGFGYWVFGTTHKDVQECGSGTWYGDSEAAESHLVSVRPSNWSVCASCQWMKNAEPARWDGDHFWSNDGYASVLYVP